MTSKEKNNEYSRKVYRKNLERGRAYNRKSYWKNKESRDKKVKEYHTKVKSEVMTHYSDGKLACLCCGVKGLVFLTIDHINGDGGIKRKTKEHKKGMMFYIWLRVHKYPKGFQVLCHNCNQAKKQLSKCPHELLETNKN